MKKILLFIVTIFAAFSISNAQNNALQIMADGTWFECTTFMDFTITDLTYEAWIKLDAATTVDDYTAVVDGRYSDREGSKALVFKTINEKLTLGFEYEGQWGFSDEEGLNEVQTGVWTHVALVIDGTAKTATFYVDGNQGAVHDCAGGDPVYSGVGAEVSWDTLFIGNSKGTGTEDRTVIGLIDELRVWSVPRSAAEIADNMGKEIDPSTEGLLAYYPCNELPTSTTLTDATGNGNDATAFPTDGTGQYIFIASGEWVTESSISDVRDISTISTFPNPVRDMLNFKGIELKNPEMRIYDATGRLIEEKVIGTSPINVAFLETGLYIIEIKQGKNLYIGKFIKE
jgi:hypothetical protein